MIVWLSLVAVSPVRAQSNNEGNSGVQFDFSLPGARSLALAGAFVGLADDATAAWANPAGLLILAKTEVSVEGRGLGFSNLAPARGHSFGSPTGIGVDTIAGVQLDETNDHSGSLSFLSFVYANPAKKWRVAGYRHQYASYRARFTSDGIFNNVGLTPTGPLDRIEPFTGDLSLDLSAYGVSGAYQLTSSLSVGVGFAMHHFSFNSTNDRFSYLPGSPGGFDFLPANFSPSNRLGLLQQQGKDWAPAIHVGALWTVGPVAIGGSVRRGPEFGFISTYQRGPGDPDVRLGLVADGSDHYPPRDTFFKVPDVYAVGAVFRPLGSNGPLLVTTEYDRVLYSQISDLNVEVLDIPRSSPSYYEAIHNQVFPNVNQFRVGVEYQLNAARSTTFLRIGTWYDPDHRLRYVGDVDARMATLFRPGSDQTHITPGVGWSKSAFQFDVGFDLSPRVNTFSASTVFRF